MALKYLWKGHNWEVIDMKIDKIKPIPKYIAKKIIKLDKSRNLKYNQKRFYAYFTKNDGELVKVTVKFT